MKKLFLLFLFFVTIVFVTVLQSCKKDIKSLSTYNYIDNTKLDTVRVYNLLLDSSNNTNQSGYLLYVNDSLKYANDSLKTYFNTTFFKSSTGTTFYGYLNNLNPTYVAARYFTVPSSGGTFTVKLVAVPTISYTPVNDVKKLKSNARVVVTKTFSVPAHSGLSDLFFYQNKNTNTPDAILYRINSDDPGAPAPGKFKIRLLNFSYQMSSGGTPDATISPLQSTGSQYTLQLQYADSTLLGDNAVPFASASSYQQLDFGIQQFLVYNSTTKSYLQNSGRNLGDVLNTFDLSDLAYPQSIDGTLSQYLTNSGDYNGTSTINFGNKGTYSFSAGFCYTVLAIGDMYAISIDKRYGAGTLDNFGKIQVVNANPAQQDMEVKISYSGGQSDFSSLPFGKYTNQLTIPAGNIYISFISGGIQIYNYNLDLPRLLNYTLYYTRDLKGVPYVYPIANSFDLTDWWRGSRIAIIPVSSQTQLIKVNTLSLIPDIGNIYFTSFLPDDFERNMSGGELSYKQMGNGYTRFDGSIVPQYFNMRMSAFRPDILANQFVATLVNPFPKTPAPGIYTLLAAGTYNSNDPKQKPQLFLIKQSNFINKAN